MHDEYCVYQSKNQHSQRPTHMTDCLSHSSTYRSRPTSFKSGHLTSYDNKNKLYSEFINKNIDAADDIHDVNIYQPNMSRNSSNRTIQAFNTRIDSERGIDIQNDIYKPLSYGKINRITPRRKLEVSTLQQLRHILAEGKQENALLRDLNKKLILKLSLLCRYF